MVRAFILMVVLFGPTGAMGQVVEGILLDAQSGRPLAGAFLSLIAANTILHDTTTSDRRGQFSLVARGAGTYVISAEREAYASILSDDLTLAAGVSVSYTLEVAPLSLRNMQQIAETLDRNERLRGGVAGLCSGRMNPLEGGILLGVVRDFRDREPVSGAIARFSLPDGADTGDLFTAVTDRHGTYLFCFVPRGADIRVSVDAPGYRTSSQEVEVRSGTISWYDFRLRRLPG
jgi:Carboxypeptidase regulatory-like domain